MSYEPVVIIGGGFAGLNAALTLDRLSRGRLDCPIFLIDPSPYHLYTPSLQTIFNPKPKIIAIPFDAICEGTNIQFLQERVVRLDKETKHIFTEKRKIHFGDCIIAAGSIARKVNSSRDQSSGIVTCKTIDDAFGLRTDIDHCLQEIQASPKVACHSHILIIGGGPTGVEFAAGIAHYAGSRMKSMGRKTKPIHITLIESTKSLLPQMPKAMGEKAARYLKENGVSIALEHAMTWRAAKNLAAHQGDSPKRSLVWASGVEAQGLSRHSSGLHHDRQGRILVDAALQVVDGPHLWAVGDMASVIDSGSSEAAIAHGKHVAKAIYSLRSGLIAPAYIPQTFPQVVQCNRNYGLLAFHNQVIDGPVVIWYKHIKLFWYVLSIVSFVRAIGLLFNGGTSLSREGQWCDTESKSKKFEEAI